VNDNFVKRNSHPHGIAVDDINNDNWLDIVVVNSGTDNIGIFLGNNVATFTSQTTYSTGDHSRPMSVVLGDFNNDTYIDIAVANYDTHNVGILFGYGNGIFKNLTTFFLGSSRPISLTVGDFNNDHCLDIVVTNNGTNNFHVLFGYGNGSFGNQITYNTGYDSLPYSVVTGDFNNDYQLDIAIANYGTNNIGIFLGYGNGSFKTQITYSTGTKSKPYSLAIGDFNDDSRLDLAVANTGMNNIGILLGYGNGSFAPQTIYSITPLSNIYSIIVDYFDKDNQLDIAVSNYDTNNILIFIGYGNGSFATPTVHSTGAESGPFGMVAGDFDNDNQSDIAVTNSDTNEILVLIEYTMKQSENRTTYSTGDGSSPNCIVTSDFNNDNQLDLVVANYGTDSVGVFLGGGNGSFGEQIAYSSGYNSHPYAVTVNDMDNDDQLDILIANSNTQSLGILFGYGNGSFASVMIYFTGSFSSIICVMAADFNNDSRLDIAFADYGNNNLGILFGYGNRTFGNLTLYSTGVGSRSVCIAVEDFSNDGRLDIAVANYGSNTVYIFIGSDLGNFSLFMIYSTGDSSGPKRLFVADLDKDSQLDIIVPNDGTDNIGILYGFGNGTFAKLRTYSTGHGSTPHWVSIADINHDSWLDLVVANLNNNNVGVLLADGHRYFGDQSTYSSGSNSRPTSIAIGDFNNDNRLDIAVANTGTQNVAILLGHLSTESTGNESHSNSSITNYTSDITPVLLGDYYADFISKNNYSTGSSSSPYSIAFGDFNNDTQMDFVVANSDNENIGVFLGYNNETFAVEVRYSVGSGSKPEHIIVNDFNNDGRLDIVVTNPRGDSISVLQASGNGIFPERITYSTGSGSKPSSLAVGNLNNDNWLDLIITNEEKNTLGIFFGFDYASFDEKSPCQTGIPSSPYAVATGDFNNDDQLDVVSANHYISNIGVFLGYGDGNFTSIMTYSNVVASHPWAVAVGDFNNDNFLDITVANWGIDNVGVVLGYGNGSFGMPTMYSTDFGSHPLAMAVGDFNNDSNLDITVCNWNRGNIGLFLGYGNGTFRSMVAFSTGHDSGPTAISIADINNDAHLDIIVANEVSNNMGIFFGHGNGSFAEQTVYSTGDSSAPYCTAVGDFNNDHYLDIVVANFNADNIGVFFGYGNGTFGNFETYETGVGSGPAYVKIGDFNNDKQLDLVVINENSGNVGIFFGYGDGTFTSMAVVPLMGSSGALSVVVGNFNNDTRLDFAVADPVSDSIRIFIGSGSRPFGGQTTFSVGDDSHPSFVAIGHFNNDNLLDIAITNYATNSLGILLGYGNRIFSNITTYSTGDNSHPSSLAVGNFNNDSLTDIVVANSVSNNIVVFVGLGSGNFSILKTYSTGDASQPVSIAVGDFNRDYQLDIVVANFGTNNVCVFFGSGDGRFTNQTWYPLEFNAHPSSVIFKDLNNDGWEDIAVSTYGTNNVKILWNTC
jgi:hypothetical protein